MLLLLKQNLKTGLHIRLNNSFYVSIVAPDRSKLSGGHGATSVGQVINLYWMSLGGILLCITGDYELFMVNFDSIAITSKVVCLFVFLIPIFSFQVLKPCLLILDGALVLALRQSVMLAQAVVLDLALVSLWLVLALAYLQIASKVPYNGMVFIL